MPNKLDNMDSNVIDKHEQELETALKSIREAGNSLKQDIENMDEKKLITVIEKNFKNGEKWKTYSEIKNSPAYAFITQAAIDILGQFDSELDKKLNSSGKIDMNYGGGTRALVRRIEACLGIPVDQGLAGPDFFDAVIRCLKGELHYDTSKINVTPQRRPHGEIPSPTLTPDNKKITEFTDNLNKKIESQEILGSYGFREEFNTGDHETPKTHAIRDSINKAYDNWNNTMGTIHIAFWGGTDKMSASANYRRSDYLNKKNAIITMLSGSAYSNMPNRGALITYITDSSRNFFDATSSRFTSKYLVGCRNLEAIKVTLEEYKTKFKGANIAPALEFDYLGDMDQAGDKVSQQQRFVEGVAYIEKKENKVDYSKVHERIHTAALHGISEAARVEVGSTEDNIFNEERQILTENRETNLDYNKKTIEFRYKNANDTKIRYHRDTGKVEMEFNSKAYEIPINFGPLTEVVTTPPDKNYPDGTNGRNHGIIRSLGGFTGCLAYIKKNGIMKDSTYPIEYDSTKDIDLKDGGTLSTDTELIENEIITNQISGYMSITPTDWEKIIAMCNKMKEDAGRLTDYNGLNPLQKGDQYRGSITTY